MAKDAFYFQHDYEPLGDAKIQAMLSDYGAIGYGIYWRIVEMFHSETLHKLPFKKYVYSAIAKQMSTNVQQSSNKKICVEIAAEQIEMFITDCIDEYELFHADDHFFWSNRALRNIENRDDISEKRSKAGKKSAEARKNKAIAQQNSTSVEQVQTNVQQNPTKEIKEKEIYKEENKKEESHFQKKNNKKYPLPENFNGLPKEKISAALEAHTLAFGIGIVENDVNKFWGVFKIENLTGENFYESEEKVYTHFIRWIRKQPIKKKEAIPSQHIARVTDSELDKYRKKNV